MQVLKDDVKERLYRAALLEFKEKGFQKSSMRNIAKKAGMTVGNLYRYCRDKEDLFYSIINPAYEKIVRLINEQREPDYSGDAEYEALMEHIAASIMEIHRDHRYELYILVEGSKGTKYENARDEIISLAEKQIEYYMYSNAGASGIEAGDGFFARALAVGFVEGLLTILRHYDYDGGIMKKLILEFQNFYFKDFKKRLGR